MRFLVQWANVNYFGQGQTHITNDHYNTKLITQWYQTNINEMNYCANIWNSQREWKSDESGYLVVETRLDCRDILIITKWYFEQGYLEYSKQFQNKF